MAAALSAVCCTLMILAFAQVLLEAVLPDGGTRRFVVFLAGLITVAVITGFLVQGSRALSQADAKSMSALPQAAAVEQPMATDGENPYKAYFQKLIDQWK
jgi:hypothetical protein